MTEETENMEDMEEEKIVLVDEDGVEHNFSIIDSIEMNDREYVVLLPEEDEDPDDGLEPEAIILRVESDDKGEEVLVDIEDDDEWEAVADAWQDAMENE